MRGFKAFLHLHQLVSFTFDICITTLGHRPVCTVTQRGAQKRDQFLSNDVRMVFYAFRSSSELWSGQAREQEVGAV